MGNSGSTQRKAEKRQQHDREVADDIRRIAENGERQKREMDLEHQNAIFTQKERSEKEIAETAKQNLAEVEKKIAEVEGLKQQQEMELLEWHSTIDEKGAQRKAQLMVEGDAELSRQKQEKHEETIKLETRKSDLDRERTKLLKMLEESNAWRTEMQKNHNNLTAKQTKEHQDFILTANANLNEYVMRKQSEIRAVAASGREQHLDMLDKRLKVLQARSIGGQELLSKLHLTSSHDELRSACQVIQSHFNVFRSAYNSQELALTKLIVSMSRKKALTKLPQSEVIYAKFDKLNIQVDQFSVPDGFEDLAKALCELKTGISRINQLFLMIEGCIEDYQEAIKEMPPANLKLEKLRGEAETIFATLKKTIGELNKVIKKFDIPESNTVDDEVDRQMLNLRTDSTRQITGGSAGYLEDKK